MWSDSVPRATSPQGETLLSTILSRWLEAADITGWSYSLESLMQADPEYIMIRREDSATFCRTKPYNKLTAVKTGKVIAIESGTIDLQVPRNLQAILYIREKLSK